MTDSRKASILGIATAGFVFALSLMNVQAQNISEERRKAILEYPLNMDRANHLLAALPEMTQYVLSLPDYADRLRKAGQMTLAEQSAQMEKDSRTMDILKRNGLTARDYVVGVPALRMAIAAAGGASGSGAVASPANVAFAKANLSVLKPRMDAADGVGARR